MAVCRLTEVFSALNTFEDAPLMKASSSKLVTQSPPLEPRNFVGVNAASIGSNDPISTTKAMVPLSKRRKSKRRNTPTGREFVDWVSEWHSVAWNDVLCIALEL